jgi:hypothetical protein
MLVTGQVSVVGIWYDWWRWGRKFDYMVFSYYFIILLLLHRHTISWSYACCGFSLLRLSLECVGRMVLYSIQHTRFCILFTLLHRVASLLASVELIIDTLSILSLSSEMFKSREVYCTPCTSCHTCPKTYEMWLWETASKSFLYPKAGFRREIKSLQNRRFVPARTSANHISQDSVCLPWNTLPSLLFPMQKDKKQKR